MIRVTHILEFKGWKWFMLLMSFALYLHSSVNEEREVKEKEVEVTIVTEARPAIQQRRNLASDKRDYPTLVNQYTSYINTSNPIVVRKLFLLHCQFAFKNPDEEPLCA